MIIMKTFYIKCVRLKNNIIMSQLDTNVSCSDTNVSKKIMLTKQFCEDYIKSTIRDKKNEDIIFKRCNRILQQHYFLNELQKENMFKNRISI